MSYSKKLKDEIINHVTGRNFTSKVKITDHFEDSASPPFFGAVRIRIKIYWGELIATHRYRIRPIEVVTPGALCH